MHALLYLQLASWQGLLRSRLRRLQQPKYLVGALVGAAYIYFFFVRRTHQGYRTPRGDPLPNFSLEVLPTVSALGALGLLIAIVLSWVLPRASASLALTETEIAFLFPAPLRRRTLIHYRLLKTQFGLAFTSLILTFFSNRWAFLGGSPLTHAVGWWIILSTLTLHFTGSSFALTRLRNRGVPWWVHRLVVLTVVVLVIAITTVWIRGNARIPEKADLTSLETIASYLADLLSSGPIHWVLALPRLVLAPFIAPDAQAFALALPAALGVLGAHYMWVLFTEVSFEEASVVRAEKRAARLEARREGKTRANAAPGQARRAPFRLAPTGRAEMAFLWKNLLAAPPLFRPRNALIVAAVLVGGYTALLSHGEHAVIQTVVFTVGSMIAAFTLLLGPQIARYDLRADLLNADILKTYPLHGWQIVLGQLLTPVAILTGVIWLAVLAAALSTSSLELAWLRSELRTGIAIGLALLTPALCALQLLVPNALALLFPAWAQTVANRGEQGLDVMGQRIIFIGGQLLVVALALLPAAIVAALIFLLAQWLLGPIIAAAIAALVLLAILLAEVWIGVRWLGRRFERFDLTSELRV